MVVELELEVVELDVVGAEWFCDFPCDFDFDLPCDLDVSWVVEAVVVADFAAQGPAVSPCLRCAGSACCEIEIVTVGWDFDPVWWQTVVLLPYWYS